jgi:hypothetical protein
MFSPTIKDKMSGLRFLQIISADIPQSSQKDRTIFAKMTLARSNLPARFDNKKFRSEHAISELKKRSLQPG